MENLKKIDVVTAKKSRRTKASKALLGCHIGADSNLVVIERVNHFNRVGKKD